MNLPFRSRIRSALAAVTLSAAVLSTAAATAAARPVLTPASGQTGVVPSAPVAATAPPADADQQRCGPSGVALGYSDALDKLVVGDAQVGGLSALAWDPTTRAFAAVVDDHADDPARVWFLRGLSGDIRPVGAPLVLMTPDGTPYTGRTADNEGLAVLPDGRFVVSSEVEPSVRIFAADGVQQQSLPVPQRFAVAPLGQAKRNATFEGLTTDRHGHHILVSTEATLSGDTGDGTFHRILDYTRSGTGYRLAKQIGYRTEPGMRIPEIQEYAPGRLLIMEAGYRPETGNTVRLYAARTAGAHDVTRVGDLADHPRWVVDKTLVADVTACPDLGATSPEPQANPLMDNYEAMTTAPMRRHWYAVTLLSDDNFNPLQKTRVLRLAVHLP